VTRSGKTVGSDTINDDVVIKSEGNAKVTNDENGLEEVKDNEPKVSETEANEVNPRSDNVLKVGDVVTLSGFVKLLIKIPPPFPRRFKKKEEDMKFKYFYLCSKISR